MKSWGTKLYTYSWRPALALKDLRGPLLIVGAAIDPGVPGVGGYASDLVQRRNGRTRPGEAPDRDRGQGRAEVEAPWILAACKRILRRPCRAGGHTVHDTRRGALRHHWHGLVKARSRE